MTRWKFQQIEPQKARGTFHELLWLDPNWVAEEKYDGDRRIAQFCDKVVRFTGCRKSVKDGLFVEKTENIPHLSGCAGAPSMGSKVSRKVIAALKGTVLDGEIVINGVYKNADTEAGFSSDRGGLSKFVTAVMGSLRAEAVRKQVEHGWLRYVVFDCLFYKGKDIRDRTLVYRQRCMREAVSMWALTNPFVSVAVQRQNEKEKFLTEILERGGEGVVLKRRDHRYGMRGLWVKLKRTATADVVIMGFKAAKAESKKVDGTVSRTKYADAGLIGAIRCGQYYIAMKGKYLKLNTGLKEIATVSGMDDQLRLQLTRGGRKYVGLVIEIEHNGREPTGRFRHPRFNRFRPDKNATDCVYRRNET